MYAHYNQIVPDNVCDGASFERWVKLTPKEKQNDFVFDIRSIMQNEAEHVTQDKYPDMLSVGNMRLPLEYNFDPLAADDGATLTLPIAFLDDINPNILEWGVYGFLYEKIVAMLRALPKNIRKSCVPVPRYAKAILESIDFEKDKLHPFKTILAKHITRIVGASIDDTVWDQENIEKHLIVNIKVVDESAKQLAIGRDIYKLRDELKQVVVKPKVKQQKTYHDWDFGDIKPQYTIKQYGIDVKVYGCLECKDEGVQVSYQASKEQAELVMSEAISRLIKNRISQTLDTKIKKNSLSSLSMAIKVNEAKDSIVNRAISLSFIEDKPIVYTKKEFEVLLADGLESFDENKKGLELLIADIEKYKLALVKKLTVRKIPLNFIELYADIKKSIDTLFYDAYITDVPYKFLLRYRYYVQSLDARLTKAVQNLQRDRAYAIEISELVSKLNKVIVAKNLSSLNSDVLDVKFLITELWVSWYLQSVKTIEPVSSKRISKKISELK
jgi:ATP-dependent helicase HrpA